MEPQRPRPVTAVPVLLQMGPKTRGPQCTCRHASAGQVLSFPKQHTLHYGCNDGRDGIVMSVRSRRAGGSTKSVLRALPDCLLNHLFIILGACLGILVHVQPLCSHTPPARPARAPTRPVLPRPCQ